MMSVSPMSAPPAAVPTASGYLSLLKENDATLQLHALQKLLECVNLLWHEIAEALPDLEAMAEDGSSGNDEIRQTAAAVASRVFFHLEEPTQALRLALEAGPQHFDPMSQTPYVQKLVQAALDAYMEAKGEHRGEGGEEPPASSPIPIEQLKGMLDRLFEAACQSQKYQDAVGIALEAREIGKLAQVLQAAGPTPAILQYALHAAITLVSSKTFRQEALQQIALFYVAQFAHNKDAAYDLTLVYQLLGDAKPVAEVLSKLLGSSNEDEYLMALQLCFDIADSGDQAFAKTLAAQLQVTDSDRAEKALKILVQGFPAELALSFLHKQSKTDRLIIENMKKTMEERSSGSRSSLLHNMAVMTHSYLYAGTTNDSFLRDHLDWMKKASNWAKFSATASIGVIHASHGTEAMNLLEPYLPATPDDVNPAPVSPSGGYSEGGSLYALGLIHGSHPAAAADKRKEACEFIRKHLRNSHANEVISHGAALGVGLTAMGSADLVIVNELKEVLDTDSAVAGEAAGMAIGMVLVGTGAGNTENSLAVAQKEIAFEIVEELKNYARETQHEKIIRGIAMGLALTCYGQEENADALIEELRSDRDPIMRYGAQYAIALAYCGTGSNKAVRILLHTAVSDVSDDVRMAAVIGLAFVLFKTPERVPELVKLLLESFNPHVRYASCMAVGIAMAGTGDSDSIALLEPMLDDMTDYVRQGALMGTAMIYMQQSDTCNGRKIRSFREKLSKIVSEKHHTNLSKMGAVAAAGIIDAGGRNCTLTLGSRNGFTKMSSSVGLALWLQHWYWYPMMHMFSLALTPTLTIALNKDFKYPKNFEIVCNSKPSAFAYPKQLEEKKEEKKKRVETVMLSITAKEKARLARKRAKAGDKDAMDTENTETPKEEEAKDEEEEVVEEKKKKKREPEPKSFRLSNPCRITKAQAKFCAFDLEQRYRPVRPNETPFGVILVTDSTPGEKEDLGAVRAPSLEPEGELPPPEPFEWKPPVPPNEEEEKSD